MRTLVKELPNLSDLLLENRELIIRCWVEKIRGIPGSHYQNFTIAELTNWVSQGLTTIISVVQVSDSDQLDGCIDELTIARLEADSPIFEVVEGLLLSKEAILPIIWSSCSADPAQAVDIILKLDAHLRYLISCFEKRYSEVVQQKLLWQIHHHLAESESLQRTTTALLQKLELDEVLEIVCSEAQKITGASGSALLLKTDSEWLYVAIGIGNPLPGKDRLPIADSIAGLVVESGIPYLINEPSNQRQAYNRNPELQNLLAVPLKAENETIGAIDVVNKPDGFTEDDARVMGLFADQAAIAIETARLHEQSENLAVMKERQRLARELHVSITQSLYSITLFADAARVALTKNKVETVNENLMELRKMAREAMIDMRLLIFELHPPIMEKEGLVAGLQTRLDSVEVRAGIHTSLQVEGEINLPIAVQTELYRIVQETLNNVVRHAQADEVSIHIVANNQCFKMIIQDNGIGFDLAEVENSGGLGLRSIQERVTQLNGQLIIDSMLREGTSITILIER